MLKKYLTRRSKQYLGYVLHSRCNSLITPNMVSPNSRYTSKWGGRRVGGLFHQIVGRLVNEGGRVGGLRAALYLVTLAQ